MATRRHNSRTWLLLAAEAGPPFELVSRHGYYKAALVTVFCLSAFYLYDLYDFIVMSDRRELVLRLVQALGLAWVALAIVFYVVPRGPDGHPLMLGRGV